MQSPPGKPKWKDCFIKGFKYKGDKNDYVDPDRNRWIHPFRPGSPRGLGRSLSSCALVGIRNLRRLIEPREKAAPPVFGAVWGVLYVRQGAYVEMAGISFDK